MSNALIGTKSNTVAKKTVRLPSWTPGRLEACDCKRTHPHQGRVRGYCPEHEQQGHVHGVKISACRSCGHVRLVATVTGLCGNGSCIASRLKKFRKRTDAKRAASWVAETSGEFQTVEP